MDQAAIDTQADLIFSYLKAIYDVAEYAEPLVWLIKTQLPKADILDAARVNTIMDTVRNCLGYRKWFTSHVLFQSALVLIIFDYYKALHYKDLSGMVTKYPQFSCLSTNEQKQLLSFRNLLVVAVKIFDPHENAIDVLTLVGSICGHTSSWFTCPTKRSHRELIFLHETGIEARYPPINAQVTSVWAAKSYIPTKKPTSLRGTGTGRNDSATKYKRRTKPTSPSLRAPAKRARGQQVHVKDETSGTQIGPSVAEGVYDILQLYRAYNNSSEGSDDDADSDTGEDKPGADAADNKAEEEDGEEEDDDASLQSTSEDESEKEEVGKSVISETAIAAARCGASTSSNRKTDTKRPNNTNRTVWSRTFEASSYPIENTMHHNNVHIAPEKVFHMAPFPCETPGSMYALLNAHLGYHAPPPAAMTHSMPGLPSVNLCYGNPALYHTQPGGGLSEAYSSQYATLPSGSDHYPVSLTVSMASLPVPTASCYSSPLPVRYATTHLHPQSCTLYPVAAMPRTVPIVSRAAISDNAAQPQDVRANSNEVSWI